MLHGTETAVPGLPVGSERDPVPAGELPQRARGTGGHLRSGRGRRPRRGRTGGGGPVRTDQGAPERILPHWTGPGRTQAAGTSGSGHPVGPDPGRRRYRRGLPAGMDVPGLPGPRGPVPHRTADRAGPPVRDATAGPGGRQLRLRPLRGRGHRLHLPPVRQRLFRDPDPGGLRPAVRDRRRRPHPGHRGRPVQRGSGGSRLRGLSPGRHHRQERRRGRLRAVPPWRRRTPGPVHERGGQDHRGILVQRAPARQYRGAHPRSGLPGGRGSGPVRRRGRDERQGRPQEPGRGRGGGPGRHGGDPGPGVVPHLQTVRVPGAV